MFTCERCGSSFHPLRAAAMGNCPRCRMRDGIWAPLKFVSDVAAVRVEEAVSEREEVTEHEEEQSG